MKTFVKDILEDLSLSYRDIVDQLVSLNDCHEITDKELDEALDYLDEVL